MSKTIREGLESGELKVGDKVLVEVEITQINQKDVRANFKSNDDYELGWLDKKIIYTKPVAIPPNCELVATPKIGSKFRSVQHPMSGEVTIKSIRVGSINAGWSIDLEDFNSEFEPVLKRRITPQEAVELLASKGENVEII